MSEKFNWENAEDLRRINDEIEGDYLAIDFGFSNIKDRPGFLVVTPSDSSKSEIRYYRDQSDIDD
jgi:hypothetical protein